MSCRSNEQKLINAAFSMVLLITSDPHVDIFKKKSMEEKAEWVREQLAGIGFKTSPCGGLWGVLDAPEFDEAGLPVWKLNIPMPSGIKPPKDKPEDLIGLKFIEKGEEVEILQKLSDETYLVKYLTTKTYSCISLLRISQYTLRK